MNDDARPAVGRTGDEATAGQHVPITVPQPADITAEAACPFCGAERDHRDPLCHRCADALAVQLRRRREAESRLQPMVDLDGAP